MKNKNKMNGNYYKLDVLDVETLVWGFWENDSSRIRENDTQYITEINTDAEDEVSVMDGVEELTEKEFKDYCVNISDWAQRIPGSRPPHIPRP